MISSLILSNHNPFQKSEVNINNFAEKPLEYSEN